MISLARYVRHASAAQLTNNILSRLDEAMAQYLPQHDGRPPQTPAFISESSGPSVPDETQLQIAALANNQAVVAALKSPADLLGPRLADLSIAFYDGQTVRDAWGSPIVFMPTGHLAVGMGAKGWFFFSAGPDRQFLTRVDNLYSYEQCETPPEENRP